MADSSISTLTYTNSSRADLGLATTDSPEFTAINLGHASDTTLARGSAGVVTVEGKTLVNLTDGGTFLADISVPDEAYGAGWNGSMEVPTKNAVYDKIQTIGGGTPGGSDTQIQFNDATSFGGDTALTWNKTTNVMTVGLEASFGEIDGASATTADTAGGDLYLSSGAGNGTGAGGLLGLYGNSGGATSGTGGKIELIAGSGGLPNGNGGDLDLTAGSANGSGTNGKVTINTSSTSLVLQGANFFPNTSDTVSLGTTTKMFSDLFLASGAVLNFDNGNAVVTHSSGILTVSTGDLRITTAGTNTASVVTVGGTQTLTSKTLTSPTLTTPSAFTTGGTITLAENTGIALDPAGSADGKWSGITVTGTAGYTQSFGDLVYLDPTDSRWEAADANSASAADGDARGILGMVVSAGTDGTSCTILLHGIIRADAKFPTMTVNAPMYVSETAGSIVETRPSTASVVIRVVGFALTADELYFNPSSTYITQA